ncbi:hypothetical protein [Skermanella aerolata]|nr:hypothetical protein [Skermanella aerolata]KJB90613.1 hypothetical protein N826_38590 [Skermanella aerolata KACC 11604]
MELSVIFLKLGGLIMDHQRSAVPVRAVDKSVDLSVWEKAGMLTCRGLKTSLNEPPVTVAEFAARFEALIKATTHDDNLYIPCTLVADVRIGVFDDIRALIREDER